MELVADRALLLGWELELVHQTRHEVPIAAVGWYAPGRRMRLLEVAKPVELEHPLAVDPDCRNREYRILFAMNQQPRIPVWSLQ